MMRVRRGIVELAYRVDHDFANQPALREQVERVVNRGLGHAAVGGLELFDDLLGRQVLRLVQQDSRDLDALRQLLSDPPYRRDLLIEYLDAIQDHE